MKEAVIRRSLFLLLALLLLVPLFPAPVRAAAVDETFEVTATTSTELAAGATNCKLYITVKNQSAGDVTGVSADIAFSDGVLTLAGGDTASKSIGDLKAGASKTITYTVDVSAAAPSAAAADLTIRYNGDSSEAHGFSLDVANGAKVSVRAVSFSKKFYAGTTGCMMSVTLVNSGTIDATDVNFTLSGFSTAGIMLDGSSVASQHIEKIEAGKTSVLVYQIKSAASASGTIDLKADISYSADGFPPAAATETLGIPIEVRETVDPPVIPDPVDLPELIVESFTADKDVIYAGSTVKFSLKITNPGYSLTDTKVRVTITAPSDIMLPSGQSNVIVLDPISSSKPGSGSISFDIKSGLESQMCDISIRLDYTDATGKVCQVTDTRSIKINGSGSVETPTPKISLSGFATDRTTVNAGGKFTASLNFKNAGTIDFSSVSFSVTNLSAETFSPVGDGGVFSYGALKAGASAKASFALFAGNGLTVGPNELEIKGVYTTVDGQQGEFSYTGFVQVAFTAVSSDAPNLVVTSATAPNAKAGGNANLTVIVENKGKGTAESASLTVSGLSASGIMLQGALDTFALGTIKSGEKKSVVIPLKISKDAPEYLPLELTPKCAQSDEATAQTVYLTITPISETPPEEEEENSLPRVIVDSYLVDPETVQAGGNFQFDFHLKNTSKTQTITNIKITVSSTDGIFTPVSGGNTFYTESIAPGASEQYGILLNAKAAAEQKSYPIVITVEYEYGKGKSYSGTEEINIYVIQPIRLEFTNVNFQPSAMSGESIYFSMSYYNKGKSPLSNLTVSMEGDFMLSEGEQFIGNFPAGSGDYFEEMLMPMGVGMLSGKLVFAFEDAAGNPQRMEVPINVEVMEGGSDVIGPVDPIGPIDPVDPSIEEEGGGLAWYWWAGGGVLLAAILVLVIVLSVRAKKKKAADVEWDN